MKDLFKKIVKPLLLVSLILLFSCEKDLYEDNIKKAHNGSTQILTGTEAQKVALRLNKHLSSESSSPTDAYARTFNLNIGTISYDEIIKVIDAMGKENYSFKLERPESSDTKFYNIVLQEEENTTIIKLIEYSMDNDFAADFKVNQDLLHFKGTIKFTPIYNDSPCPEPEVIIQVGEVPPHPSTSGGGATNNNNYPVGNPIVIGNGGHGTGLSLLLLLTHSGGGSAPTDPLTAPVSNYTCPPGSHYNAAIHDCEKDRDVNKMAVGPTVPIEGDPNVPPVEPTDPCAHNTEIGILPPYDKCTQSFLVGLDNLSKQFLLASINNNDNVYNELMEYIFKSPNCDEAGKFGKDVVSELKRGGRVDYKNRVIIDSTFVNKKLECIHNKLKAHENLYSRMLSHFNDTTHNTVTFSIGNTDNNDFGITKNLSQTSINWKITLNNNVENGSNLLKMVNLGHELLHAYMMTDLVRANYIRIDDQGYPRVNFECPGGINYNQVNLNELTIGERFVVFICAMQQNGTFGVQWTHELFNSTIFDIETYREQLETMIFEENDWDNETTAFREQAISVWGSNWKHDVAKAVSYLGLELTEGFVNYRNSLMPNVAKFAYFDNIKDRITIANSLCQP